MHTHRMPQLTEASGGRGQGELWRGAILTEALYSVCKHSVLMGLPETPFKYGSIWGQPLN